MILKCIVNFSDIIGVVVYFDYLLSLSKNFLAKSVQYCYATRIEGEIERNDGARDHTQRCKYAFFNNLLWLSSSIDILPLRFVFYNLL